jgi:hypothetical protein
MSDDDPVRKALEDVLADPEARPSTKVQAAKQLAALRGPDHGAAAAEDDPRAAMRAVVERLCPGPPELRDVPADPMRDLDFEALVGRPMDPVALSWLPYLPAPDRKAAERVERDVVAAARRLGVGRGPHEIPESADELAKRRRRRAS